MGKIIVFLPIIIFFGFFGLLIVGFFTLVFKLIFKSKASYWKGEIIDKKHNQVRDRENPKKFNHFYYLVVKTDEGKEIKVGLSQMMFDKFKVGEKIEKPKGKLFPEKI